MRGKKGLGRLLGHQLCSLGRWVSYGQPLPSSEGVRAFLTLAARHSALAPVRDLARGALRIATKACSRAVCAKCVPTGVGFMGWACEVEGGQSRDDSSGSRAAWRANSKLPTTVLMVVSIQRSQHVALCPSGVLGSGRPTLRQL